MSLQPTYQCPHCAYDLRAARQDEQNRYVCTECGNAWLKSDLVRAYGLKHLEEQPTSVWMVLSFLLPALIAPWLAVLLTEWIGGEGIAAVLLLLAGYALVHCVYTTEPKPFWAMHVAIRAAAMTAMIVILAIGVAIFSCLPIMLFLNP